MLDEISRLLPLALSSSASVCNSVIGIAFLDAVVHSAQILNAWLLKVWIHFSAVAIDLNSIAVHFLSSI